MDTIKNPDPTERIMALFPDESDHGIGVNQHEKAEKRAYDQPSTTTTATW